MVGKSSRWDTRYSVPLGELTKHRAWEEVNKEIYLPLFVAGENSEKREKDEEERKIYIYYILRQRKRGEKKEEKKKKENVSSMIIYI